MERNERRWAEKDDARRPCMTAGDGDDEERRARRDDDCDDDDCDDDDCDDDDGDDDDDDDDDADDDDSTVTALLLSVLLLVLLSLSLCSVNSSCSDVYSLTNVLNTVSKSVCGLGMCVSCFTTLHTLYTCCIIARASCSGTRKLCAVLCRLYENDEGDRHDATMLGSSLSSILYAFDACVRS